MNKLKKFISLLMACAVILSVCPIMPIKAEAKDIVFSATYSGEFSSNVPMVFSIATINPESKTFTGHLKIDDKLVKIDKDITGTVNFRDEYYSCQTKFKSGYYEYAFNFDVYPLKGAATMVSGGGGWLLASINCPMTGTVNKFYTKSMLYDEADMKMCMALSMKMYSSSKKTEIINNVDTIMTSYNTKYSHDNIDAYNIGDKDKDNVAFSILNRKNTESNSIDIITVIRGTYRDEWQGNVQITGASYDASKKVHDNFNKAKESIKAEITEYYNTYAQGYDKVNLIITGHSRGAAVANLYAKEAADVKKSGTAAGIPVFDNVTAYTFACPNVEKYNTNMEKYDNIFNFQFDSDIVPSVPLTSPADGWNYWKYGKTFSMNILDLSNASSSSKANALVKNIASINPEVKNEMDTAFSQWPTVSDYYKKLQARYNSSNPDNSISLYDYLYSAASRRALSKKSKTSLSVIFKNSIKYPALKPLLSFAASNLISIKKSHHYDTYNKVINGKKEVAGLGSDLFSSFTYQDALNQISALSENSAVMAMAEEADTEITYDAAEVQRLADFANQNNNNDILNWDLNNPAQWSGITWNAEGHITSIDFTYKWLEGSLDCSGFSALESVNVYANLLTDLNLSGTSSLTALNCSYNDFSQNGLDLTDCTALNELYCDGCSISMLDLAANTELQILSCALNNLFALNTENNTKLKHINCLYNYLDIRQGTALYTQLYNYRDNNNAYINYYPQQLPPNAVVDTAELQALENFAKAGNNNSALDWLDDNGDISLEKLQYNAIWEFDGEKYKIVEFDISDLNISGEINLTAFTMLRAFYCENTQISKLNLNSCTNLEELYCDRCKISEFALPSNAADSSCALCAVSCEYNYIDTAVFTESIIDNIKAKQDYCLNYLNQRGDASALQAAIGFAELLEVNDYSSESFGALNELLDECRQYDFDNLCLTQADIDALTAKVLTAAYNLKAYFNVKISASNGTYSIACDNEMQSPVGNYNILYSTAVSLNAVPNDGFQFVGWYDTVCNRYLSRNAQYNFTADSNISLEAVCIANGSATLTFSNSSSWIAKTVTKTTADWAEVSSVSDLLPDVPYSYGHGIGRWEYDEQQVLASLRAGEDVTITAVYDENDASYPVPRQAEDKPVLDLYFNYDFENSIGSFLMAAGFPENIEIESVGIAFYYKNANTFNPSDNFILLLNNKMLVGRFNTDRLEDIYIVNMNKMTSTYNWAARGYVTYYDENNTLVTVYSNQINIVDRAEVR